MRAYDACRESSAPPLVARETSGRDDPKLPLCWIGEDREQLQREETLEVTAVTVGDGLREFAHTVRGGQAVRSGRTIGWVDGEDRATVTLDASGRVERGTIVTREDGRLRLTIEYPEQPFKQVVPEPICTDEQISGDG